MLIYIYICRHNILIFQLITYIVIVNLLFNNFCVIIILRSFYDNLKYLFQNY
jgi:hypothetical protein